MKTTEMETVYDLGAKMIEAIQREKARGQWGAPASWGDAGRGAEGCAAALLPAAASPAPCTNTRVQRCLHVIAEQAYAPTSLMSVCAGHRG